jgi:hypothetical protein
VVELLAVRGIWSWVEPERREVAMVPGRPLLRASTQRRIQLGGVAVLKRRPTLTADTVAAWEEIISETRGGAASAISNVSQAVARAALPGRAGKVSTGTDGESGLVATGPTSSATTWQIPADVLRDGVTYYWAVWSSDGNAWTKSTVRRFTVDHQGISPPGDEFGGVSVNLINGRGALTVRNYSGLGDGPGAGGEELGEGGEGVVAVFAGGVDVAADIGEGLDACLGAPAA